MSDTLWKQTERKLAQLLGGQRIPVHSTSGVACDVSTPTLSCEVKERKDLPAWLEDAVDQSKTNCEANKMPVVILHKKGSRLHLRRRTGEQGSVFRVAFLFLCQGSLQTDYVKNRVLAK